MEPCSKYGLVSREYLSYLSAFLIISLILNYVINDTLYEYLDIFCTIYLNDILIYSNNPMNTLNT